MKKLKIILLCSLLFTLILGTNSFAGNTINLKQFYNIIENGTEIKNLDVSDYTYTKINGYTKFSDFNGLVNILNSSNYAKYIQAGDENFENQDTCFTLYYNSSWNGDVPDKLGKSGFKFNNNNLIIGGWRNSTTASPIYIWRATFNTINKTCNIYTSNNTGYTVSYLNYNNFDVTLEQFKSDNFQRIQYWNMFIYSTADFYSSNGTVINNTWNGQYISENANDGGLVEYSASDNLFLYNFVNNGNVSGDFTSKIYLQTLNSGQITSPDNKFGPLENDNIKLLREDTFSNVSSFSNDINLNDIAGLNKNYIYRVVFKTYDGTRLAQESYSQFISLQKYYIPGIIIEDVSSIYTNTSGGSTSGDTSSGDNKNDNQDYWGDIDNDKTKDQLDSDINNITNDLNKQLETNEIIGALNKSEQGFLNIIGNKNAQDFKISWNPVNYNGIEMIPKGEINFSKMCRENETLGTVKTYVNVIMSAFLGFALTKQIYNLLLATLGIDNQYVYENPNEYTLTSSKNLDTGETTYTKRDRKGNTVRYTKRGDNR